MRVRAETGSSPDGMTMASTKDQGHAHHLAHHHDLFQYLRHSGVRNCRGKCAAAQVYRKKTGRPLRGTGLLGLFFELGAGSGRRRSTTTLSSSTTAHGTNMLPPPANAPASRMVKATVSNVSLLQTRLFGISSHGFTCAKDFGSRPRTKMISYISCGSAKWGKQRNGELARGSAQLYRQRERHASNQ